GSPGAKVPESAAEIPLDGVLCALPGRGGDAQREGMEGRKEGPGVVVGYDGSRFAVQALDWARDEAALRGGPLTVCDAWRRPERAGVGADADAARAVRRAAEQVVRQGAERARRVSPGLPVHTDLYEGSPAERLVELSP